MIYHDDIADKGWRGGSTHSSGCSFRKEVVLDTQFYSFQLPLDMLLVRLGCLIKPHITHHHFKADISPETNRYE